MSQFCTSESQFDKYHPYRRNKQREESRAQNQVDAETGIDQHADDRANHAESQCPNCHQMTHVLFAPSCQRRSSNPSASYPEDEHRHDGEQKDTKHDARNQDGERLFIHLVSCSQVKVADERRRSAGGGI